MGVWIEISPNKGEAPYEMSHPLWVCGLKSKLILYLGSQMLVTPFMGVWIEILQYLPLLAIRQVTPFMGVWIEISLSFLIRPSISVTPFMGVWIEISRTGTVFRA